jgi:hypothetical protein
MTQSLDDTEYEQAEQGCENYETPSAISHMNRTAN